MRSYLIAAAIAAAGLFAACPSSAEAGHCYGPVGGGYYGGFYGGAPVYPGYYGYRGGFNSFNHFNNVGFNRGFNTINVNRGFNRGFGVHPGFNNFGRRNRGVSFGIRF